MYCLLNTIYTSIYIFIFNSPRKVEKTIYSKDNSTQCTAVTRQLAKKFTAVQLTQANVYVYMLHSTHSHRIHLKCFTGLCETL